MKHCNRVICLLLAGALVLLGACNSGGQNSGENMSGRSGRYVETDITPPVDGRFVSFLTGDGAIVCFSQGLVTQYLSTDGGVNWTESQGPGIDSAEYQDVRSGTLLPDGRILAYIQEKGLVIIMPDGGSEPFPATEIDQAIEDGKNVSVSLLQSLGNDRLLISYDIGGIMIQDERPGGPSPKGGEESENVIGSAPADGMQNEASKDGSDPALNDQTPEPQDSGQQDSGQRSVAQEGSGPQRSGAQSNYSFAGEMVRKTILFELSTVRLIAELPIENAMAATADDENIYHMDAQGNIKAYSLADGSSSNKLSNSLGRGSDSRGGLMPSFPGIGGDILAVCSDGGLYALYDRNLLLCHANGDIESILEGTAYSIGAPNSSADSVFVLHDGSIVVNMLANMQENRLYKYEWDENAVINPDKVLSVWSLEENTFVRAAIAELRKKNPDSYITYDVAIDGKNAVLDADAIKTLNTRLLSGSGPDVIILDGCPEESYAGKGMLLELTGLVDTGGIYQNLLLHYALDGKVFYIPTQLMMPMLMGEADALGKVRTLDDLVALVVSGNDSSTGGPGSGAFTNIPENERAELYFQDLEELCDIMWLSCAPAVIKDNKLDAEALKSYLDAIKAISDKYGLAEQGNGNMMGMGVAFASGGQVTVLPSSLVRYTSQMTNYGAFSAGNLMLLQLMMERNGSDLAPFPGLTSGAWRPSTVAGICADTRVQVFAVELLRTMLSIEVQQINYGAGLPVTRDGIAQQIKAIDDNLLENDRGTFDIDIDALIGNLKEPSVNDKTLSEMMWASVEKLCMGKIDVEGAVREIEQSIKNYLAERS